MSNKSRRGADTSRRRVAMAAGVLLAGAAIPITTAGTAWADTTSGSDTAVTTVAEAKAEAEAAIKAGDPVSISINGDTKDYNGAAADGTVANSGRAGEDNVAVAIGAGSSATDDFNDKKDLAVAYDTGKTSAVFVLDANNSTASAAGAGSRADIENLNFSPVILPYATNDRDTAVASGADSAARVQNGGIDDKASATGTRSYAYVEDGSSRSTATANGTSSIASVVYGSSGSTASATGAYSNAGVDGSTGSTATDNTTGENLTSYRGWAQVTDSHDSSATSNTTAGSRAYVLWATDSSEKVNNGDYYAVSYTDNAHFTNGVADPGSRPADLAAPQVPVLP